jgi:hypothetical protein
VTEATGAEERNMQDVDAEAGPTKVQQAKAVWAALPLKTRVQTLVTIGLSAIGAATVLRMGGKAARAGVRRVRR